MCVLCNPVNLSFSLDDLEPELKRVAKLIYDGKLKPNQIDKAMTAKIAEQLMKGFFRAYGESLDNGDISDKDKTFLTQIEKNVYVFSGFKNYQQLKETTLLLKDDKGVLKPFNQFLNDVKTVNQTYNQVYLRAEYGNAIASAQAAATWNDYEDNDIDMLNYVTAGDDRVREEHAILDGITLSKEDGFWDTYYPPNDWGCRCGTQPAIGKEKQSIPKSSLPDIPEMFRNNVGKSGVVFPDTHPYYDVSRAAAKAIKTQVDDILEE